MHQYSTPDQRPKRSRRLAQNIRIVALLILAAAAAAFPFGAAPAHAAVSGSGTMVTRTNTLPHGAVFLNDANGGHWWVTDQVLGICEATPQAVAGQPPFALTNCNGTAKSGAQVVVGDPAPSLGLPAGTKFVYVADNSSKSIKVVRFQFNPAGNGSFSANAQFNIANVTAVGGGTGGGRPTGIALVPHKGAAANGGNWDLYTGYKASGDIMRVDGVDAIANNVTNPPVAKVGSTSDGRGLHSLLLYGNDLYLAELGGFGLSKISDPSGITRTPCSATAVCTAVSLSPNPDFFPGGLATDGKYIFIGDVQLGVPLNALLRYNPATGITDLYSQSINPSYTEGGTTYTSYIGILGLGYNAATGDLFVGDDPQFSAATPVLQQGHVWKVAAPAQVAIPTVTSISPTSGTSLGGDVVTITGTGFDTTVGATTVNFGANAAANVTCASATSCTATSPAGLGTVDVVVTVGGQSSPTSAADLFTYVTVQPNAVTISSVAPNTGITSGGTAVTITGTNFVVGGTTINFGANAATNVVCASATTCTAVSPAGAAGVVDVQVTDATGTSAISPSDQFTYITPTASLYSWGVTAPKGGAVWLPGALGGHWWSSDHAQGLCRQDPMSTAPAAFQVPGDTLHAINLAVCASDLVGSAGQAVYDSRFVVDLATGAPTTFHYVYVPDNAVKSTAVWRLTFDPATETMVADPNGGAMATAMTPLADVRTLKPNGMALGPDGNLYVTDLVEPNVRKITNPDGDPRTQVITIVAVTGDNRGANGTQGFIGNLLYISGNRASQFFDITQCPMAAGPCGMASVPAPTGVFIAGTATDPAHKLVYLSSSPGAANASIMRYDASNDVYVPFLAGSVTPDAFGVVTCPLCTVGSTAVNFINGGILPAPGSGNGIVTCALTCQRPWDETNHPTTGIPAGQGVPTNFSFAFGLGMDPNGTLVITEDPSAGARSGRGTMWAVPFIP
ncbi:MAG TPA: IPT/TIG domain-containing protein [Ktedonobacterales bacterium]|nr:IPT/TIG domain-containing protein [Ktedonobacterales bacterium]